MPTGSLADAGVSAAESTPPVEEEEALAAEPQPRHPSLRHPVVKVALVGLPVLALAALGFGGHGVVAAVMSAVLVALAAIDIDQRILPNRILLPAIAVVLVLQLAFFPGRALEWLLAGPAAAAFLALPLLVRRDAMGLGDIKLVVLLGIATGWAVFGAIVVGCLTMVPAALWLLRRDGSIRNATLPFGPFLGLGTLVILYTT
ncbi:MAG: leader peptidase (prepilin peptidase) / N-methyltransferase [Solirubrobacteraceae bacterium]|jgi:leader peptidase (prepilin peptidase)/N-methyltransferase|nr:leader peptidase (prepilin peptidase) / N-methyltransferase [Solirubrobacteraceae bacterium]